MRSASPARPPADPRPGLSRARRLRARAMRTAVALGVATAFAALPVGPARTARADAPPAAPGASRGDAFARANAADAAGRSAEAADGFAALAAAHGSSPELLLNLGNASARAGRTGEAILAWERALVLDPGNAEVGANLRALRRRANLPEGDGSPWSRLVARFGADGWARVGSGAWIAAWLLLLASALAEDRLPARSPLRRVLRIGPPSLLVLFALALGAERTALADLERAVVLGDGGGLRSAPFPSAPQGQAVVAGEIVRPERSHEDWVLVTTAAGKSGWLESSRVGRVGDLPGPAAPG